MNLKQIENSRLIILLSMIFYGCFKNISGNDLEQLSILLNTLSTTSLVLQSTLEKHASDYKKIKLLYDEATKETAKLFNLFELKNATEVFVAYIYLYRKGYLSYNKKFQPSRTDFDWLTRDEAIVDSYIAEPRCQFVFTLNGYHELFRALIYIEKRKNIEKLPKDLPVLFVSGDKDPVGNFGKGVDIVCETWEEAGLSDVTLKLFEGGRHEILNEIDRNEVYEYLYQWLTDVAGYKA